VQRVYQATTPYIDHEVSKPWEYSVELDCKIDSELSFPNVGINHPCSIARDVEDYQQRLF